MQIPYDEFELKLALMGLNEKLLTEEKMKELGEEIKKIAPEGNRSLNEKVAEHQGISVIDLINSPNYGILKKEYAENMGKNFVKSLIDKLGITEKEAWAITATAMGLLD